MTDNDTTGLPTATGTWVTASVEGEQGFNHRTHAVGTGTDAFTWKLDVPADGTYDLYVTYPQVAGAATGAKYELTHDPDGPEGAEPEVVEPAVTVNQTTSAGAWRKVASYGLSANEVTSLKLAVSGTGTVVADAVKLVRDNSADADSEQKTFTYGYDVNGNLNQITDESHNASVSSYEMVYDQLNQVASVTENATAGAVVTGYGYNPNGQLSTVDHPDQAAEYGYDLRNLVETVTVTDTAGASAGDPTTTSYTYDERGSQVTQTKGNGNVVTNAYFNDGALRSMREETSGGALVALHEYTYNENGSQATDVASKRNADTDALMDSTTSYTYDPVDRLVEKVKTGSGASSETYVHDDNANVVNQTVGGTTTTYGYDRNRLQSATVAGQPGSASYTYDPFGRQASVTAAGLVISRNTYDGFDHVVKSEKMNDAGTLEATTYTFDPLDRTTSKTAGGDSTRFTYLGLSSEVLTEDVAGALAKSYQYSPWGQRLSQVTHPGAPDEGDGDGAPEIGTAFYGYNAHTDVETLTDQTGGTVATYGYTAYGKSDDAETTGIDKPNPASPDAELFNAYRYNSKRFDAASGTYDMGFRNYDPGLNRFTSRDMYDGALADLALGSDPYTGNRYAFTGGNPINRIELDGHIDGDLRAQMLDEQATRLREARISRTLRADSAARSSYSNITPNARPVVPGPGTAVPQGVIDQAGLMRYSSAATIVGEFLQENPRNYANNTIIVSRVNVKVNGVEMSNAVVFLNAGSKLTAKSDVVKRLDAIGVPVLKAKSGSGSLGRGHAEGAAAALAGSASQQRALFGGEIRSVPDYISSTRICSSQCAADAMLGFVVQVCSR